MGARRISGWIRAVAAANCRAVENEADPETKRPLVFSRKSTARRSLRIWLRGQDTFPTGNAISPEPAPLKASRAFSNPVAGLKKVRQRVYHFWTGEMGCASDPKMAPSKRRAWRVGR
jgi:hypothetical protein